MFPLAAVSTALRWHLSGRGAHPHNMTWNWCPTKCTNIYFSLRVDFVLCGSYCGQSRFVFCLFATKYSFYKWCSITIRVFPIQYSPKHIFLYICGNMGDPIKCLLRAHNLTEWLVMIFTNWVKAYLYFVYIFYNINNVNIYLNV